MRPAHPPRVTDPIFSGGNGGPEKSPQELACHRAVTWPSCGFERRSIYPQRLCLCRSLRRWPEPGLGVAVDGGMSEEDPQECAKPVEPAVQAPPEKTSDYYRVAEDLPVRFNNPAWFRGYRTNEPASVYRTSNQTYGSRAPTVHEMPKVFYANSNKFSRRLAAGGMFRNNTLNVYMEKSIVTGAGNCITSYDRFNFQPSYNVSKPSICD